MSHHVSRLDLTSLAAGVISSAFHLRHVTTSAAVMSRDLRLQLTRFRIKMAAAPTSGQPTSVVMMTTAVQYGRFHRGVLPLNL